MRIGVFGNPTIDEIRHDGNVIVVPGGSSVYVSAASAYLGARVDLVGNVGSDYPEAALRQLKKAGVNVDSVRHSGASTTKFELTYRDSSRRMRVLHAGGSLSAESVKGTWHAAHFCPVFGEVDRSMVLRLRHHSQFVSLDLQGFVRGRQRDGSVRLVRSNLAPILRVSRAVKASLEEAMVQTGKRNPFHAAKALLASGPKYAIVTLAGKGAALAVKQGDLFRIPAYPEKVVVDPTGAGDGFVGAWLSTMLSTWDPVWAASVGAALASLMLRRHGIGKFRLSRQELFRRSSWVYRNVRRQ